MKLIESKAEYIPQATVPSASAEELLEGVYKQIELAGRTAYHSQDKITPTSAKNFVDSMIKSKHGACLEHGTVYLKFSNTRAQEGYCGMRAFDRYRFNPYSKISYDFIGGTNNKFDGYMYIVTNYRVLVENNWLDDLQYLCSPTELHEKRYTMRFTCSRAIAQELTRHRVFSFLMESQRYINYSKERHGGEITYIIPSWLESMIPPCSYNSMIADIEALDKIEDDSLRAKAAWFTSAFINAEKCYFEALNNGCTPQQARDVLPNATKTELIMTGFASDWKFLMDLRLFEKTGKVHPDMLDLMQKALGAMQVAGIWKDIMSNPSKFD